MAEFGQIVKSQPIELRSFQHVEPLPVFSWRLGGSALMLVSLMTSEHVLYRCFRSRHALQVELYVILRRIVSIFRPLVPATSPSA